jgi:hypothetical protein
MEIVVGELRSATIRVVELRDRPRESFVDIRTGHGHRRVFTGSFRRACRAYPKAPNATRPLTHTYARGTTKDMTTANRSATWNEILLLARQLEPALAERDLDEAAVLRLSELVIKFQRQIVGEPARICDSGLYRTVPRFQPRMEADREGNSKQSA